MLNYKKYTDILDTFTRNNVSISDFVCTLAQNYELFVPKYDNVIDIFKRATNISTTFASDPRSYKSMQDWILYYATELYADEVGSLTGIDAGL